MSLFTHEHFGEPPPVKLPPAKPCRAPDSFFDGLRDVFREHEATLSVDEDRVFITNADRSVLIFDLHELADKVNG